MKKQLVIGASTILCLALLYSFRYNLLYPGVSRLVFTNNDRQSSLSFTIPNVMLPIELRSTFGEVALIMLRLDATEDAWGTGKYYLMLFPYVESHPYSSQNIGAYLDSLKEIPIETQEFENYKKYGIHKGSVRETFMLQGNDATDTPIYLKCIKDLQQLQNCTFYGVYRNSLAYELIFPGTEIENMGELVENAELQITLLLDKE
jgi:hypothetical protein